MTRSSGACRREDGGFASSRTSRGTPRCGLYLIFFGEKPPLAVPSKLSDILETGTDPKYDWSPTACLGILRRAERRGKELPEVLREALTRQAASERADKDTGRPE